MQSYGDPTEWSGHLTRTAHERAGGGMFGGQERCCVSHPDAGRLLGTTPRHTFRCWCTVTEPGAGELRQPRPRTGGIALARMDRHARALTTPSLIPPSVATTRRDRRVDEHGGGDPGSRGSALVVLLDDAD